MTQSLSSLLVTEVILYDLEYTAWPGSKEMGWSREGEHREIVEIGAVKVVPALDGMVVKDQFQALVRPTFNPILSDYFVNLTSITQEEIDRKAKSFAEVFGDFMHFCGNVLPLLSFGEDDKILKENLDLNQLICPIVDARFINYRSELCKALNIKESVSSADLPSAIELHHVSSKHRALGDVAAQIAVINHALKHQLL